ncbi:MAG: tetratricopeptide repeat protein [Thermodesulfobacteriota bacterium]
MTEEKPAERTSLAGFVLVAALILTALTAAAYRNTLNAPFVFDDRVNVLDNPSILSLHPLWDAFWAPPGKGTAGRPLINFTYALNYAVGRLSPPVWHATNIAVHIIAVLALFGILLRAFSGPRLSPRTGRHALFLAFACSALWAVHPLLTESVSYVTQRAESIMGAFYLLCLLFAVRSFSSRGLGSLLFQLLSVLCFILGVGSKEVIVTAPLLAYLYDVILNGQGPFRTLRRKPLLYAGFLVGMILLFLLVRRGGSASSDPLDLAMPWYQYALLQPSVILHYLRLSLWPDRLCFDYLGLPLTVTASDIVAAVLVFAAVATGAVLCIKRKPAGYLFAWFFLILAPTSSIMPLKCLAYEHRMYLSLIALIVGLVVGAHLLLARFSGNPKARKAASAVLVISFLAVLAALFFRTVSRNDTYSSAIRLWSDTLEKLPANHRAHINLAQAYSAAGDLTQCVAHYQAALAMKPDYAKAHYNLANTLERMGRNDEAEKHYRLAISLAPALVEARVNYAALLIKEQRTKEAEGVLQEVFLIEPGYAPAHYNLANLLAERGEWEAAARHYEQVLYKLPGLSTARINLGACYARTGRYDEAIMLLMPVAQQSDAPYPALRAMAQSLEAKNDRAGAAIWFRRAAAKAPSPATALALLGRSLYSQQNAKAAREQVARALELEPQNEEAREAKRLMGATAMKE